MDPCFFGRNAAVLKFTQFSYVDESTRRIMSNFAIPKPGSFEDEWAKMGLAPSIMRRKVDLQEAALIALNVRPEMTVNGKLLTRTALTPDGCKEIVGCGIGDDWEATDQKSSSSLSLRRICDEVRRTIIPVSR